MKSRSSTSQLIKKEQIQLFYDPDDLEYIGNNEYGSKVSLSGKIPLDLDSFELMPWNCDSASCYMARLFDDGVIEYLRISSSSMKIYVTNTPPVMYSIKKKVYLWRDKNTSYLRANRMNVIPAKDSIVNNEQSIVYCPEKDVRAAPSVEEVRNNQENYPRYTFI